jgi:hypothetical protein
MGTLAFIAAVAAAIAFAWARGRKGALAREIAARPVLDVDAMRTAHMPQATLDPRTTRDVLTALGAALGLDPGRLRLDDRFEALWDMDPQAGFHQRATFEDALLRRFPKLPADLAPVTVADLIVALERIPLVR